MDSSLNLPALRALDLSNNNITAIQNLHLCSRLSSLNLSYNNIASLDPLRECTISLQQLKIQVCIKLKPLASRFAHLCEMRKLHQA